MTQHLSRKQSVVVPIRYLSDKAFNNLKSDKERLSYLVLRIVSIDQSNAIFRNELRRFKGFRFREVPMEYLGRASSVLSNNYVKTSDENFLKLALDIPSDGAYAEGRELYYVKCMVRSESADTEASPLLITINQKLQRRSAGNDDYHEVLDFLESKKSNKFVESLRKIWVKIKVL